MMLSRNKQILMTAQNDAAIQLAKMEVQADSLPKPPVPKDNVPNTGYNLWDGSRRQDAELFSRKLNLPIEEPKKPDSAFDVWCLRWAKKLFGEYNPKELKKKTL